MKTITIAGGGLAGLSLGIALRRAGVPVDLHESSQFPRHRVCGEFISGVSDETLDRLGIAESLRAAESLVTTSWYDRNGRILEVSLPTPARGISRYHLDRVLASEFESLGGRLHLGKRFPMEAMTNEGVVRATGREIEKGSDWLGLKAHWFDVELEADLEMHLGDEGYIGLSRVEDGRTNVAGLFRRRSGVKAKAREALIAYADQCGLGRLAEKLRRASLDRASCLGVSSFRFGFKSGEKQEGFRLGDQLAIIPPFTGNGMTMALQSAESALPHLVSYSSGENLWRQSCVEYDRDCETRFSSRLRSARMIHPFLFSPFGQRFVSGLGRRGLLPFSLLYRAVR